jgi:hypothetical protein
MDSYAYVASFCPPMSISWLTVPKSCSRSRHAGKWRLRYSWTIRICSTDRHLSLFHGQTATPPEALICYMSWATWEGMRYIPWSQHVSWSSLKSKHTSQWPLLLPCRNLYASTRGTTSTLTEDSEHWFSRGSRYLSRPPLRYALLLRYLPLGRLHDEDFQAEMALLNFLNRRRLRAQTCATLPH